MGDFGKLALMTRIILYVPNNFALGFFRFFSETQDAISLVWESPKNCNERKATSLAIAWLLKVFLCCIYVNSNLGDLQEEMLMFPYVLAEVA